MSVGVSGTKGVGLGNEEPHPLTATMARPQPEAWGRFRLRGVPSNRQTPGEELGFTIVFAKIATTVVRGFCMGAADIVPGVSGGTIALVFGIYERLIDNVRRGARALRLSPCLCGWAYTRD